MHQRNSALIASELLQRHKCHNAQINESVSKEDVISTCTALEDVQVNTTL